MAAATSRWTVSFAAVAAAPAPARPPLSVAAATATGSDCLPDAPALSSSDEPIEHSDTATTIATTTTASSVPLALQHAHHAPGSLLAAVVSALGLCPCCRPAGMYSSAAAAGGATGDDSVASWSSFSGSDGTAGSELDPSEWEFVAGENGAEWHECEENAGVDGVEVEDGAEVPRTEEKEEQEDEYDGDYEYDRGFYDDCDRAEAYEAGLYNQKRGGGTTRSKGSGKYACKQDDKTRRQLRSGHVKAVDKHRPLQRPPRTPGGVITFTPPGCEGHGVSKFAKFRIGHSRLGRSMAGHSYDACAGASQSMGSSAGAHNHHQHAANAQYAAATPFALSRSQAVSALEAALADMQHRDLTPEDYEMLLRLDESVKAKTLAATVLHSFPTRTVTADSVPEGACTVCMDAFADGDEVRTLPCSHVFHSACINQWLSSSSDRCPVDSLPVKGSQ